MDSQRSLSARGVNFTYLSGMAMPGTLARHLDIANTVRGFMVLWPRHGEPIIVLDAFAEKLARRESWIERVEVYQAYVGSLYTRVAELIAEAGLATARVGFEQDGLSAAHWEHIQTRVARTDDGQLFAVDGRSEMDQDGWRSRATEAGGRSSRRCVGRDFSHDPRWRDRARSTCPHDRRLHEARSCLRAWHPELEFERRHVWRRKRCCIPQRRFRPK